MQWLGVCRTIYNVALECKSTAWKEHKTSISKYDLMNELPSIRKSFPWVKEVNAQTLQAVIERLDNTYTKFLKGGGFPKWADKEKYSSFNFKQSVKINSNTNTIQLPKIGKIKYHKSREIEGKIKTTTVKKEADGWFVYIACETEPKQLPPLTKEIGIDLGIKDFATFNDGTKVTNPKHLEKYEHNLKRLQRNVTRKKKGSNNRKKAVQKLALCYLKIRECRKDFHHKLSTKIIRENQTIMVEDLSIGKMTKKEKAVQNTDGTFAPNGQKQKSQLNKAIGSAGWGQFVDMLEYKSKWYGRNLVKVTPQYTSQDCSSCGHRNEQLTLQVREWKCPKCGVNHDRDVNAAINIMNKGRGAHAVSLGDIQPQ